MISEISAIRPALRDGSVAAESTERSSPTRTPAGPGAASISLDACPSQSSEPALPSSSRAIPSFHARTLPRAITSRQAGTLRSLYICSRLVNIEYRNDSIRPGESSLASSRKSRASPAPASPPRRSENAPATDSVTRRDRSWPWSTEKDASMSASAGYILRMRAQNEWMVPMRADGSWFRTSLNRDRRLGSPEGSSSQARITSWIFFLSSPAACSVKVTATTEFSTASVFLKISTNLRARTVVFPDPAFAVTDRCDSSPSVRSCEGVSGKGIRDLGLSLHDRERREPGHLPGDPGAVDRKST